MHARIACNENEIAYSISQVLVSQALSLVSLTRTFAFVRIGLSAGARGLGHVYTTGRSGKH